MKFRDLANLLNRAAAALETPADLSPKDKLGLVNDLVMAADEANRLKQELEQVKRDALRLAQRI